MKKSNKKTDMPTCEKINMTLFELEEYINSKRNNRLIYTYENNNNLIGNNVYIKIIFNTVTASRYTNSIVFFDTDKGYLTEPDSNFLHIYGINKIIVEPIYSGCSAIMIESTIGSQKIKHVILYDYEAD